MPAWRWFDGLLIAVLVATIVVATNMPSLGVRIQPIGRAMEPAPVWNDSEGWVKVALRPAATRCRTCPPST
jgi:hypothetical protein